MPVVSKNTNELKTHAPGRFGLGVSRLGCAFYLFIRQPMGRKSALRGEIPWILRGFQRRLSC